MLEYVWTYFAFFLRTMINGLTLLTRACCSSFVLVLVAVILDKKIKRREEVENMDGWYNAILTFSLSVGLVCLLVSQCCVLLCIVYLTYNYFDSLFLLELENQIGEEEFQGFRYVIRNHGE